MCVRVCGCVCDRVCVFLLATLHLFHTHLRARFTHPKLTQTQVSRPYTIPFITADYDANWQGTFNFNSNNNFYVFKLFDLSLNMIEYTALMKTFEDALAVVGYNAERSELAVNLLYFNTWTHSITTVGSLGGKVTQTLSFASHAINILGTDYIAGTVMDMKVRACRSYTH